MMDHDKSACEGAAEPARKFIGPRPYKPEDWEVELETLWATLAARDAALLALTERLRVMIDHYEQTVEQLRKQVHRADAAETALRACQEKS